MTPRTLSEATRNKFLRKEGRKEAVKRKLTEFNAPCAYHGNSAIFDTMTGGCLLCLEKYKGLPPYAQSQAAMGQFYAMRCDIHGLAPFHFKHKTCTLCFDSQGRTRRPHSRRTDARRGGERTYQDVCQSHGQSEFWTVTGACAKCFTAGGIARVRFIAERNPERMAARQAGAASYMAECGIHGPVPHHTVRGKCLRCFNTLGQPRKAPPATKY